MVSLLGRILLLSFLEVVSSANILISVTVPGSHMYVAANAANFLGENGHNVTLFTVANETRTKLRGSGENYKLLLHPEMTLYDDQLDENWREFLLESIKGKSSEMGSDIVNYSKKTLKLHIAMYKKSIPVYNHKYFEDMLLNWKFDLIILEFSSWYAVQPKLQSLSITTPVVILHPMFTLMDIRSAGNYPLLLNSEPNFLSSTTKKPTFVQRLRTLGSMIGTIIFAMSYNSIVTPMGLTFEELTKRQEMHFGLGHPALSFASLTPPNYRYLGFFTMKDHVPKSLPEPMLSFMDGCGSRPIIYMSFGTFLPGLKSLPWLKEFLNFLMETDICLLFKAKPNEIEQLSISLPKDRVYMQEWMPQKDILSNNKIKFFISHCGNNGRLEAIFFTVPILCLPLFVDQYLNAILVQHKEFGEIITKENITQNGGPFVIAKVAHMLGNVGKYKKNILVAKETVINDPGSGKNVFLYHINHIIKHGNAKRYLNNEIILNQSIVEIYNLDIFGIALVIIITAVVVVVLCMIKLMKHFYGKTARSKTKME